MLAKSKQAGKSTEAAPVSENENTEILSRTPSPVSVGDLPQAPKFSVSQPKWRKVLAPMPAAGGFLKIVKAEGAGYIDREPCRKIGDRGVDVLYKNPRSILKGYGKEAMNLWWAQIDEFAVLWCGGEKRDDDMEWVNQFYPKEHWKTRKALADREAMMEEVRDEDEDEEIKEEKLEGPHGGKKKPSL
ncbi:hypothetical protein DPSP01_005550 [Paraphaeosphaeria sporulosa]|uniref:Uncharacterized protein n=1 Tax=Paraphaeosphaeria sporulosa TaxID=1460663 RepID=A0A177CSN9_9PLEO|nr:uncharacterized protein CC84DRAFT_1213868 [Paraphaeosphaeria sporulosa]OAG10554.1 hypothetical protein CC84DRAFT_1213868 [Paraphaeosphaeria sporulosa]